MESLNLSLNYQMANQLEDLPPDEQALLLAAREASNSAYAPYSHFHVGAALQCSDGTLFSGNNQENKAYPSGICAERTALFYAGSKGKAGEITKIALFGKSLKMIVNQPVTPCGACRQVMLEYEQMGQGDWIILMQGDRGPIIRVQGVAKALLPFSFNIQF